MLEPVIGVLRVRNIAAALFLPRIVLSGFLAAQRGIVFCLQEGDLAFPKRCPVALVNMSLYGLICQNNLHAREFRSDVRDVKRTRRTCTSKSSTLSSSG